MTSLSFIKKYHSFFLLITACLLFGFNNALFSWFVFFPVIALVYEVPLKKVWIYGGLYGVFSYLLYLPWLLKFSPVAMAGVSVLYFCYCSVLFFILKLCIVEKRLFRFCLILLVLCLYEFVKTLGFTGFSYGVNAYSQWKNLSFIQIADFSGVWGVSFILNYFSVLLFELYLAVKKQKVDRSFLRYTSFGLIFVIFSFSYGIFRIHQISSLEKNFRKIKVCAIQNNCDPWKSGIDNYSKDIHKLMELSDMALSEHPDTEVIIWPETAVVPSILKNYYTPNDVKRNILIKELLEYINSKKCGFLIGNFNSHGDCDYNSVLFFIPKKNVIPPEPEVYSKIHLVPFTEYFPYEKQFPALYKFLLDGDTHLWTPGDEYKVFEYEGLRFSTPVCFEDNFGGDLRNFKKSGTGAFFNLSNDAWSKSKRCQVQHLKMAVFRSVENHIPSVRSTASGETCFISSIGKIYQKIPSFTEGYAADYIPVIDR